MLITITEIGTLNYHMHLMRKSVKKGFKRTYGAIEGKRVLEVYDSACNVLVGYLAHLQIEDKDQEYLDTHTIKVELDEEQKTLLHSFLDWYTKTLLEQAVNEGVRLPEIRVLLDISMKLKENVA